MSNTYISADVRRPVVSRSGRICEYCFIHGDDTFYGCEVDHIISVKHDGPTVDDNLALACSSCNRRKGSDLGSLSRLSGQLIRFFNPRTDRWLDHFRLEGVMIAPVSDVGEVTARIFGFNETERLDKRMILQQDIARYPSKAALRRMAGQTG